MRGKRASEDVLPRKEKCQTQGQSSGMRSFAMKFFFDQTVGSVLNIILFIITINLLKGEGWNRIWELIGEVCCPLPPFYLDWLDLFLANDMTRTSLLL